MLFLNPSFAAFSPGSPENQKQGETPDMNCYTLVDVVHEAEAELNLQYENSNHGFRPRPLAVAARAFSNIAPSEGIDFWEELAHFARLAQIVEIMREGHDPICDQCKAEHRARMLAEHL